MTSPENRLLTPQEAADRLAITVDQLADLVRDGEISYIPIGRGSKRPRRRFTETDLNDFIDRRRRRESCQFIKPKNRRSINTISKSVVVGFTARRKELLERKQKNSRP